MKKLGYIISKNKIRGVADFIEVTSDPSFYSSEKPIMVVGLELARNTIKNFSILRKNPEKNKFWTFGKTEKRTDHERDLDLFYKFVLTSVINNISYYYLDITKVSRTKIKNLLRILGNDTTKYLYFYKEMLYLYYENYVLGISLEMLRYIGINTDKHIKNLYRNKNNKVVHFNEESNPFINKFAKNKKYLIPFFLSLSE